ncbi:glycosyltransferase family 4 protein [Flavobacterium sp.]|uniref:glycosyltransferase family 4 protein n=1 Tax=Flavobacterium sp. TaxID=239 RepID=UPI002639BB69|nr:glycosyltransferase family 4 protein [Flavobacterium sp.]
MKLLYITNGLNGSGGLERVLSIKASYLAEKMGYEVHIVCLNDSHQNLFYDFSPKIHLQSISVFGNPISYVKKYVSGLNKVVSQINPDIVLVCDDGLKAFFLPLLLKTKAKMIYERHVSKTISIGKDAGFLKTISTKFQFTLMNLLAKRYDKFVVLTNENKREWPLQNLEVISNPLSFYPEASATLTTKKVIAVGKQSHQKGYDLLLQAWQKVIAQQPDWQLEIYGKKEPSEGLELQASCLGISLNVQFFDPIKNIEVKYLESSIYVMSSRYEGFGMVLIEAMACGVPCVSFDCPYGPSDIIADGEDGYLVSNGDVDLLAEKLLLLIENDALRIKMGQKAKIAVKRFLPETICQQWDTLFKTLVR